MSEEKTFEDSLGDLERLVRDLEDGQLGLDEALARYEQGVALIRRCQTQLAQAEQRILLLTGLESDGQPTLQPFEHKATAGALFPETPSGRSKPAEKKRRTSEY
jgi:exodeoxyribonuclease VII small subunit